VHGADIRPLHDPLFGLFANRLPNFSAATPDAGSASSAVATMASAVGIRLLSVELLDIGNAFLSGCFPG
jgi:hypothetical protein